jgi:hypothetical protein
MSGAERRLTSEGITEVDDVVWSRAIKGSQTGSRRVGAGFTAIRSKNFARGSSTY